MTKKLYKLMNWAEIEGIVYSEDDNPHKLLGAHLVKDGLLIQFFYPKAKEAYYVAGDVKKEMECVDDDGYFAILLPKNASKTYKILVVLEDGTEKEMTSAYNFEPVITKKDTEKFANGIHYEAYKILGAHPMEVDGIQGVHFAVWAPNAMRVSVVGDFNDWDGRIHQMRRLWDSGIFEIFIPEAKAGDLYKFEIKIKGGLTFLKSDPYAFAGQLRPDTASVVADINNYQWGDESWLKNREKADFEKAPVSVYEVHLGSFKRKDDKDAPFLNYRELAKELIPYVKEMGYTHVELMPVMEHPLDASWGYQVIGYYAPTSRYGTPEDFMYFMDEMHKNGIGVILDWVPAHFPKDSHGLCNFDGTHLYEYADERLGVHPHWGTLIFNYGRKEVANYLIANALFWVEQYHADGIRMDAVASMLYLDYGKQDGGWIPNIYGGKENLEAIELLKHLNSMMKKRNKGVLVVAEESTAWPMMTQPVENEGLGFDMKWNMGWMNDFTGYMQLDPYFRSHHHGELTFSMIYAYSEKFMLVLSHDEVVHGKGSMIGKMTGSVDEKFKNLRAAYAYTFMHPGKKLLFMGQDIGEFDEWNENRSVEWDLLTYEKHQALNDLVKDLNHFYAKQKALCETDFDSEGFEWINNISANENVIVFQRKTGKPEELLLVVCNFANEERTDYKIGVPFEGKYREVLNTDALKYGGTGCVNIGYISSKEDECDDRENSIRIKMPALATQVFMYTPFTAEEKKLIEIKKEEERKKAEELRRKEEARAVVQRAKDIARDAMLEAENAKRCAEETMRRAKEEAKEAERLLKKAKDLEEKAKALEEEEALKEQKAKEEIQKVKESAEKVKETVKKKAEKDAASTTKSTAKTSTKSVTKTTKTSTKTSGNTAKKADAKTDAKADKDVTEKMAAKTDTQKIDSSKATAKTSVKATSKKTTASSSKNDNKNDEQ